MDALTLHQGNGDAWDRAARGGYAAHPERDVEFLGSGGSNLMAPERRLLGDLSSWCGRAIHLQCSHGLDTLSLWKAGASQVVGVDISESMLESARYKSNALNAPATWICSDVLETPHSLDGTADLVYTGRGAVCWMMDLDAWAAVIVRLLKPGGAFYLFEGHPMNGLWDLEADHYKVRDKADYCEATVSEELGFVGRLARVDSPERPVSLAMKEWPIGMVVTALAEAGLRLQRLEEHPEHFWGQFPNLPAEDAARTPHTYSVLMKKDQSFAFTESRVIL